MNSELKREVELKFCKPGMSVSLETHLLEKNSTLIPCFNNNYSHPIGAPGGATACTAGFAFSGFFILSRVNSI
jgi:hypothetical protein